MADKRPYELTSEALSVAAGDFLVVDSSTKPEVEKLSALYYAPATHTHDASAITSGQFANARISYANVAQHIGAVDHGSLLNTGTYTHGQIDLHINASANVHGIGTTALVVGTDTSQTLWNKNIKSSFIGIPNQQSNDNTFIGWQRNELANAHNRGAITVNWDGSGDIGPAGNLGGDLAIFFDQHGKHGELLNLDGTTTSLEIIIDFGGSQDNYARAAWRPFFAYRFTHPNGLESYFNSIAFQISMDGSTWDSPAGGEWSTNDFANESTSGVWFGTMASASSLASYRYVRIYLSDFQYNVGAAYADRSWISQIGFYADAAPPYRIFVRSDIDDTKYGNLTVTGNLDVTGVLTAGGISGGGEANTASNLGAGEGIYASKSGVDLRFKSLVAGDNVTLTSDANTITIDATGTGGGLSNAYSYMTDGTVISTASSTDTFKFRSANDRLTLQVQNNDATHGDNLLLTVNAAAEDHSHDTIDTGGASSNWVLVADGAGGINIVTHDGIWGAGGYSHAQIDGHINTSAIHIDWTQASQGTIHATNYVDNDTTDHTLLSNIGTNTHAQIDTHIASMSNPHSVTAAQVGAAEVSHTHTASDIDSGAATDGYVLTADGAGNAAWEAVSGTGGISNAYTQMTDGTTTAAASGEDTFKFRSANNRLTVAVGSNDATHGDNLLLTINEGNINHDNLSGFVANEHIDWTQASQGTIHATNYVDNDTTDHTQLSNIGTNTHAQIDTHIASTNNPHSVTAAQVGAAEASHSHTLTDITDSGALAALDDITAAYIDSGAATSGYVLKANGSGGVTWASVINNAYIAFSDYSNTAFASGSDTINFRTGNNRLSILVANNDPTYGDNVRFTINEGNIDHDALANYVANEHIDWTQASQGTIHATNYVDNDTTDHTQLSNIGTNTHAQIDTHIASTSNPHSVTAAQVGAAEASHTHTASDIDSGAATDGYVLTADGAGNANWEVASGTGGISSAYTQMTDGSTTASASGEDVFKFRSANNLLAVAVGSNDATHGDNLLLTINESNINHDNLSGFVANEHIDWTQASQGTIHATNYVDNDTTDHTQLSNIGTNTHAQIDTHIASTNNPHSVTAAQVGAAETSHSHTLTDITDSGSLAALDNITAAYVDSGAASNGHSLVADGAGGASWQDVSGGGLINAYSAMTDGTVTSNASGGDTFKFRSANNLLTIAVGSNDATHGDNVLLTVNEGNINHDNLSGFVANEHIDWTQASQGTIHATNYVDNDTTDHTQLSNIGTNTHAQIDTHIATSAIHIDWTQASQGTIHATNYVDNNTTDHTQLSNIGTNTHAQIDTHIGTSAIHIDWTQASQGTIHATNYVDNDTTDHTQLSNIGTNTHAQIDTHIASTSNPHSVTAAQVGAAEASHSHTLTDITDSGALAGLDDVTAAYIDSGAATNGYSLVADGAGGASWQDVSGGGISNAYTAMTDGTTTANASGSDTFKFRSANGLLTVAVGSNDATHGDNLLLTINEGSIDHDALTNYVANEHIDWTQASQGTIHATNYVDNDTTDHTQLSNIGTNTHAQIDTHIGSTSNPHSVTAAQVGAAEASHSHTLTDITDSGSLAALNAITITEIDSGAQPVNKFIRSDGAGGATWESVIASAYVAISDFNNTAFASGSDTITFRTGNNRLSVLVTSNDGIFGDNVLFTVNETNIDHDALANYVANEHIDWTQASQGTIHATNYVDNDTTDHTQLSNIGTNTHAQIDTHIGSTSNPHSVTAAQVDALPTDSGITSVSTTYTVLSSDAGKIIECNGTFTVTLPNSLDTGFQVTIVNIGTGTITLAASTTLQTKSSNTKLASQYGAATAYHAGSNIWRAFGDLTA